jgi:hypothetical protein
MATRERLCQFDQDPGISLALNPGYLQRGRNRCQPSAFSRGTTSMRQQGRPVELTASKRTSKSCG